jgi:TnpA family transposase
LDWLQNVELRRRVHAGLNKGEAKNASARAVFFNRLGEVRDRSFEHQRYGASGLNLVIDRPLEGSVAKFLVPRWARLRLDSCRR